MTDMCYTINADGDRGLFVCANSPYICLDRRAPSASANGQAGIWALVVNGEYSMDEKRRLYYKAYCKEHREEYNAYARHWRKAHADKGAACTRRWREMHRDECAVVSRRWATAHPEKIVEAHRRYRQLHPDKIADTQRCYRQANPEKVAGAQRRYRQLHPDKTRAARLRYHALKVNAFGVEYTTAAMVAARWKIWGGLCWLCGKPATSMDHVKPLAKGGAHLPCNLRPICGRCNSRKGAQWPYER